MHGTAKIAALITLLAATLFVCRAPIAAREGPAGVFVNPLQSEEPIRTAIEAALKDFNFLTRPFARSQLKKDNPVIKSVAITHGEKAVTITLGPSAPNTTEPGRSAVKWIRPDGEVFDVSTAWEGATLVQTFVASYGKRVNRYTLSADGTALALRVTLSSPQLKKPLEYQLSFNREMAR